MRTITIAIAYKKVSGSIISDIQAISSPSSYRWIDEPGSRELKGEMYQLPLVRSIFWIAGIIDP
ncbi:hypothetical protein [Terribacillus sp. 7520-G]|uniref:hypothetical protein n=1 Tax=Terribacillus TaxID=459532 RepID=UPI000BA5C3F2|nr:hypothetical protein [Terribacillus sp. 7520-G]PAD37632.1 hypothetical protein CHH53_15115 [Terribacillus sp. 7520-G]